MRLGVEAWGLGRDLRHTGIGQYAYNLLTELPRVAPDVELLAYGGPLEPRPEWLPESVAWRPARHAFNRRLAAIDSRLRELPGLARRDGLDAFHSTGVHVRPSFPPVPRLKIPVLTTVHDVLPLTHYRGSLRLRLRTFYRWNLGRALGSDVVLTVSEESRREISRATGLGGAGIRVIANGVSFAANPDVGPLERLGITRPYLLYAGSYEPRKNLAGALDAFRLIATHRPHRLVAVVERHSGHAPALLERIAALGLRERVQLVHGLSEADLRALYTHADLLLFPSLAEGFGFPPLQAAACGTPVVASDLPVLRETMGTAAEFADPGRPGALAEATLSLLDDPDRRRLLAELGLERARRFSVEASVRAHATAYRAAVGARELVEAAT